MESSEISHFFNSYNGDRIHNLSTLFLPSLITRSIQNNHERDRIGQIITQSVRNINTFYEPEINESSLISNPIISFHERLNLEISSSAYQGMITLRSLALDGSSNQYLLNQAQYDGTGQPQGYSERGQYDASQASRLRRTPDEIPRSIEDLLTNVGAYRPETSYYGTGEPVLRDFARGLQPRPYSVPQDARLTDRAFDLIGTNGTRFIPLVTFSRIEYEDLDIPANTTYLRIDFTPHGMTHKDALLREGYTTTETMLGGVRDLQTIVNSEGFQIHIVQNTTVVGTTNPVMANFAVRKLGFRYVKNYTDDSTYSRTIFTTAGNLNAIKSRLAKIEAKLLERQQRTMTA